MGPCFSLPHKPANVGKDARAKALFIDDSYEMKHVLGSGSGGDTWLCKDLQTGQLVAIKLIKRPLPRIVALHMIREIATQIQLGKGHVNIVEIIEVILNEEFLGIVMEFVEGGNMADYIIKQVFLKSGSYDKREAQTLDEEHARFIFKQIISAVHYCHRNQVAHRDLKLDNTLVDNSDPPMVKLCDFGFARRWDNSPDMYTVTGTPDYMCPELLEGAKRFRASDKGSNHVPYDGTKADVWACGVLLYVMMTGKFPFEASTVTADTDLLSSVREHQQAYSWSETPAIVNISDNLTPDCKDLLNRIFDQDQTSRISLDAIVEHPWFKRVMPEKYQAAWDRIEAAQTELAASRGGENPLPNGKGANEALRELVLTACSAHNPSEGLGTLRRLSESAIRRKSNSNVVPNAAKAMKPTNHVSKT